MTTSSWRPARYARGANVGDAHAGSAAARRVVTGRVAWVPLREPYSKFGMRPANEAWDLSATPSVAPLSLGAVYSRPRMGPLLRTRLRLQLRYFLQPPQPYLGAPRKLRLLQHSRQHDDQM